MDSAPSLTQESRTHTGKKPPGIRDMLYFHPSLHFTKTLLPLLCARKYSREQDRRSSNPAFPEHTVQSSAKTTEQEILAKYVPAEPVMGGPADLTFSRKLKNDQEIEGGPGVARLGRRPWKEEPWWAEGMRRAAVRHGERLRGGQAREWTRR